MTTSNRDERKARAEARAEVLQRKADQAEANYQAQPAHQIPLGQPILKGHYSQRAHENAVKRLRAADDRRRDAYRAADHAAYRAAHAGSSIQVSDDDAVTALADKLAAAEAAHAVLVAHNRQIRAGGCTVADCPGCRIVANAKRIDHYYEQRDGMLPSYVLANSRNRIKQIREQLTKAEVHAEAAAASGGEDLELAAGHGWQLVHAVADARVRLIFDATPGPDIRAQVKRAGFRWAPSVGAWQRQDTANGLAAGRQLAAEL